MPWINEELKRFLWAFRSVALFQLLAEFPAELV